MERIYWIGTRLAKCVVVRRRRQVPTGRGGADDDRPTNHDPEWKPVDEIKPWEYEEYEQGSARMPSAQEQRPDFEEAHEWLWPKQIRKDDARPYGICKYLGNACWEIETPHKEFEATERGLKDLLNALCYNKGSKSVLAYSRRDMCDSPALKWSSWGTVDIWLTEVARMGGTVYFVKKVLEAKTDRAWRPDNPEAKPDETDKLFLAEEPCPETVLEYDAKYGRKITRRTR
jgi:hypothetical protein